MLLNFLRAAACVLALIAAPAWALDPTLVAQLGAEDSDARVEAIRKLVATEDPRVIEILKALEGDSLALIDNGARAVIVTGGQLKDAATGQAAGAAPPNLETIVINNRIRGEVGAALAALRLGSSDRAERLAAAKELQGSDNEDALPIIERAIAREADPEIKSILALAGASLALKSSEPEQRAKAARALAASDDPQVRQLLATMLTKQKDGSFPEADENVRAAAQSTLAGINARLRTTEIGLALFSGVSLGSILLLAALGLAITYGLMGIINMAHGEFLMIGAYATYVVQGIFRSHFPGAFDWYVVAALPVAFAVTAADRHGARAWRAALAVRPAARNPADDLGRQPASDPGQPHDLRRAERRGREPELAVRWHRARRRLRAAVQPHRHRAVRAGRARRRVAGHQPHAHGALRARRDAEPRDGKLHRACRRTASTC